MSLLDVSEILDISFFRDKKRLLAKVSFQTGTLIEIKTPVKLTSLVIIY